MEIVIESFKKLYRWQKHVLCPNQFENTHKPHNQGERAIQFETHSCIGTDPPKGVECEELKQIGKWQYLA